MASLLTLTQTQPSRSLASGEVLIAEGNGGGDLYVLETGRLIVTRGGVEIARIETPGALIGEMSVLLGKDSSATVRADGAAKVRVVADAIAFLERQPLVALGVATLLSERLDATSAIVVELRKESLSGKAAEHSMFERLMKALMAQPQ